mgnify:CR=1 FL=1
MRNDGRGRRTTIRRELFALPNGAFAIDTMGIWETEDGLKQTLMEIDVLFHECRFRECTHQSEPGCAVRRAIEMGELSIDRWKAYEKFRSGEGAKRKENSNRLP